MVEDARQSRRAETESDRSAGLTSREVEERIASGDVNINTELKTKSVRELVLENLLTLFNLINVILALLVLVTGSFKNLSFLLIVGLNTFIGVAQSLRSKRMVDKLTLLTTKRVTCLRDGREVEIELDQIVLDDVIKLGRGDQIPADAEVLSGTAQVNESLLTGESDLIKKAPGSALMSGSFIDSGLVLARVVHVGADNYVARINNEAKYVKTVNSEIMAALNSIVRFASAIMLPLGLALFFASWFGSYQASGAGTGFWAWAVDQVLSGRIPASELLSTVGALLGMIPQGLVLLTSSVLAIATIRLARRKVLAQQLYCIETLARVDVLCLDKTGTITSGRMEVAGVHPLPVEGGLGAAPADLPPDAPARATLLDFALANIAEATSADANETCKALLDHYADRRDVPRERARRVIPFSSATKWSGALFDRGAYVMGASQFVLRHEDYVLLADEIARLADTCRVLVVAEVAGFTEDGEMVGRPRPLGFVTIRDEIRSSAADTIRYFTDQGVTLNVISGDDPRTVSSIARVVGIPGASAYVDATTLDTPAKVDAAVDRYHVFGRVTPQQKRELVQALQRRGHTVAMTGDGVNDVLALKEADCSVAMAAGSDAARNVAEIVLVDNDFASMPAVVAEGRRSINNLQRSAALFLTKTLFSMGLAAICIFWPPYPFQPIQMTVINFFCIGFPGFVLGLEANRARVEGNFLVNVVKRALPASVSVIVAACLCMMASALFAFDARTLSTMCLITSSTVGCCLIWRISQPFTPLRAALFAVIVVGIATCILGFPGFFSIARLSVTMLVLVIVFDLVSCALFFSLARMMDSMQPRSTRLASGLGRGVRVRVGKRGKRRVTSTGSAPRRFALRLRDRMRQRREDRLIRRAEYHARQAVGRDRLQAAPHRAPDGGARTQRVAEPSFQDRMIGSQKGSFEMSELADLDDRQRAGGPAGGPGRDGDPDAGAGRRGRTVTKTSRGIRVRMPRSR